LGRGVTCQPARRILTGDQADQNRTDLPHFPASVNRRPTG
jgi:hypothetical protein